TYLQKIGAQRHYRYATRGGLLGVLASIALGVVVTALSGPLLDLGPDLIGLGVIFVAVVVLTWHGYWMRQHARAVKGDVQQQIDEAQAAHRMWIIRSEEHTSELQSRENLVCRLLLEKKKKITYMKANTNAK